MVDDGCNLSFPAVGRHIKQWPWRGLELEKRADRIDKMGMLVLQEPRQVQTPGRKKTVKFSKFECQEELHQVMTYNKFVTLF